MTKRSWMEKHGPTWRVRMREKRKKITVRSGLTRREAYKIKRATDHELLQGKQIVTVHTTVDQLIRKINDLLRPQISDDYCDQITRSMLELAHHTGPKLSQIDIEGIDAMKAALRGDGLAYPTVNKYLRHCSKGCKKAIEWRMMSENPFDHVDQLTEPEREIRIVTVDEEKRLIEACRSLRDRCIIYLGVDGGLRAKEIANLKLGEDFDQDSGLIKILNRHDVATKTKKLRKVFIFDDARRIALGDLTRSRKGYGAFPFYDRNARSVSQRAIQIRNRAGVDCSLHDLRRTCVTRMLLSGVPVPVVAKWMGHSIRIMQDFYTRIRTQDLLQVRDRMFGVQDIEQANSNKMTKNALITEAVQMQERG